MPDLTPEAVAINTGVGANIAVDTLTDGKIVQLVKLLSGGDQSSDTLDHEEDTLHTTGDRGLMVLAVRKDAAGTLAGDGDYHALLLGSLGELKVGIARYVEDASLALTQIAIDVATAGDNSLVAAQGVGNKIKVVSFWVVCSGGANTLTFKSGTTAKTGGMGLLANLPFGAAGTRAEPVLQTAANEALQLNLAAATSVDGALSYIVSTV